MHGFGYAFVPQGGVELTARAHCRLIVEGRIVELANGENLVGRSVECTIRLDSTDVSRRHARILVAHDAATLEDLGSTNGTFVNGRRVSAPLPLTDGMVVTFGSIETIFRSSPEEPPTEVR